jgi:hypothetical protein
VVKREEEKQQKTEKILMEKTPHILQPKCSEKIIMTETTNKIATVLLALLIIIIRKQTWGQEVVEHFQINYLQEQVYKEAILTKILRK